MSTKLEGGENKLISNSSGQYKFQVSVLVIVSFPVWIVVVPLL